MMKFHWTMDFTSHQADYDFGSVMEKRLNEIGNISFTDDWKECRKRYQILPNYWGGFSTHKNNYESAGEAEIVIRRYDNSQEVVGWCHNTDSCEKYSFSYCQNRDGELIGEFESKVENLHGDIYKEIKIKGKKEDNRINVGTDEGVKLLTETVNGAVYTNWQFLHKLPADISKVSFSILEKLENLYQAQTISKLENWNWKENQYEIYVLLGKNHPFIYYFTEKNGNVVMAVHTLMTYVLTEAEFY